MVMKALQQLLHDVDWGGLDILVLDLPPGTGDTQLTITQQIKLDGNLKKKFSDESYFVLESYAKFIKAPSSFPLHKTSPSKTP